FCATASGVALFITFFKSAARIRAEQGAICAGSAMDGARAGLSSLHREGFCNFRIVGKRRAQPTHRPGATESNARSALGSTHHGAYDSQRQPALEWGRSGT